jgi:hypothetical protein
MHLTNINLVPTHSGRVIDPWNIKPEQINIQDIAIGLARQPYLAGQTSTVFTLAQQALMLAECLEIDLGISSPLVLLAGLLRHAHRAYATSADMAQHSPRIRLAVHRKWCIVTAATEHAFQLDVADAMVDLTVARDLMHPGIWPLVKDSPYTPITWCSLKKQATEQWGPDEWAAAFVDRYQDLQYTHLCGTLKPLTEEAA